MENLSDEEFQEFVRSIQQMALRAYPYPVRNGCPSADQIHAVAGEAIPWKHPLFEAHISRCSPCLREMLDERTRIQRRRRRNKWAIGATGVVAAGAMLFVINRTVGPAGVRQAERALTSPQSGEEPVSVAVDFSDLSTTRSDSGGLSQAAERPQLPRRIVRLEFALPFGSPGGTYEIQFATSADTPVFLGQGSAEVRQGTTVLRAIIDLRSYAPGEYLLGIRRPGGDWTRKPVRL